MQNRVESPFRRHIAQVLAATIGAGAFGCGANVREEKLRKDLDGDVCVNGDHSFVEGLSPSEPFDYLALRDSVFDFDTYQENYRDDFLELQETVSAIENPEEKELAQEMLERQFEVFVFTLEETGDCEDNCPLLTFPPGEGFRTAFSNNNHWLVLYEGTASFYYSADEFRQFLGPIDTPAEAALMVRASPKYTIPCDEEPNFKEEDDGYSFFAYSGSTCGGDSYGTLLHVSTEGTVTEKKKKLLKRGDDNCAIGRLPAGLSEVAHSDSPHPVGKYFSEVSYLEAASVAAFEEIASELNHHGAPAHLVERARSAAKEEERHAVLCRKIANRYGASFEVPSVERRPPRGLLELAEDNAVEGLTREAFGALLAHHQAATAGDPFIRSAMMIIAEDETGHAEFSLELQQWILGKLSHTERQQVEKKRQSALARFAETAHSEATGELTKLAGLPTESVSRALFSRLFSQAPSPDC